jgi:thiamine-phosphate pyrophosphorylase
VSAPSRLDPATLRLIAVTDSLRDGIDGLARRAAAAVAGGATMLNLRLEDESPRVLMTAALALRTAAPGVPLLVSNRADVAIAADADGVHLGIGEMAPAALRRVVPARFIIGASVSVDAEVEDASGADYVGIGPVFATANAGTSEDNSVLGVARFAELARACGIPAVAIGGIAPRNVGSLMESGAAGVAVISAMFGAPDPADAARALRSALDASGR